MQLSIQRTIQMLAITLLSCAYHIGANTTDTRSVSIQQKGNHFNLDMQSDYSPDTIYTLVATAQKISQQHLRDGYNLTIGPIKYLHAYDNCNIKQPAHAEMVLSSLSGNPKDVPSSPVGCIFCTPTTPILYDDNLVRVIKKPGTRPGTDILIIPVKHVAANIDQLDFTKGLDFTKEGDRNLIKHIAEVANTIAKYLHGPDTSYTLVSNAGSFQGVYHLHVHFKSKATLNEHDFSKYHYKAFVK